MNDDKSIEIFSKAPVHKAVLTNAIPAMLAMLMVLVYNLADTFFIGQTHDALQVAAVSVATPIFLIFMAVGTVFGVGGTSVISRAMGDGVAGSVLAIGVPAALGSLLMSVSQIIINSQMAEYGDMAIAAMGVAMKVVMITGMVAMGIGQGVQHNLTPPFRNGKVQISFPAYEKICNPQHGRNGIANTGSKRRATGPHTELCNQKPVKEDIHHTARNGKSHAEPRCAIGNKKGLQCHA